ncbi:DcrB-related protein [Cronobacter sakazakii]|uniref:DcrB-related protein n=1 Tax=Cronobacter sakazakii TaxID=28141 RepID=UPI000CFC8A55|nr:DcrB-related protein [Cronobacter sakazakii]ELQ6065144.1 DcrB-related protein [Cronobacter sakazakii]ELY2473132.1 DcrB-related protein [Cronobacter sakazakii]ELY3414566.1 DcrB-related protein [Cronobacter sakazakii]ELY4418971.1 DcrB-related protein [Cronobacter sakazakii]ELY4752816.1 DcrB-related protein [Cronobacter sakazakii]
MNLFPVSDSNVSELTFVISRASANADDKVHAVAARIVREMETSLPEFRLESTEMTVIDGEPAVDMFYQYMEDNTPVFQRQTVILINDAQEGKKMVSYIGTCIGEFLDSHHWQYQEIMQSIKFHRQRKSA